MSNNTPKFTKQDLDKLLNCSDQLQSTFASFKTATKKLNDEREKVKKQAVGIPTSTRGSTYYNNVQNKKALNQANKVIDNLVKQFSVDVSNIKKNIGVLRSQGIYEKRLNDLVNYYKQNIDDDKIEIEREQSKKAIANRMSTFYTDNTDYAADIKKYLMYLYWPILIISSVLLIYNVYHIPSYMNSIRNFTLGISNKINKKMNNIKKTADRLDRQAKKVKNPLSSKQQMDILRGPGQQARASASLAPKNAFSFSGGSKTKYSIHPWLSIIITLLSIPLIVKVASYVTPYLNRLAFPKLDY